MSTLSILTLFNYYLGMKYTQFFQKVHSILSESTFNSSWEYTSFWQTQFLLAHSILEVHSFSLIMKSTFVPPSTFNISFMYF